LLAACPPRPSSSLYAERPSSALESARSDSSADGALAAARTKAQAEADKAKGAEVYLAMRRAYPQTTAAQEALYSAATLYFEGGDFAKARQAFSQLLEENPLFDKAYEAKKRLALSDVELGSYQEAHQLLSQLLPAAPEADKPQLEAAKNRAAQGAFLSTEELRAALEQAKAALTPDEQYKALDKVTELLESKVAFAEVAKVAEEISPNHPGWPLLTFKLAKIYYHLRDWDRLRSSLQRFLQHAPSHPFAPQAEQLLARSNQTGKTKPRTVGVILPLSGRYQPFGDAVLRGIKLALSGADVELVVKDSQGDVNMAGKAVEELVFQNGAIAIIGPLLGDDSRRAALVAEELQVPLLTLTRAEGITEIGPYVFRNMLTNSAQAEALAEYGVNVMGYKRWAVLYPEIPYGEELANLFWDQLLKLGAQVRGAESYAHDQTTFTAPAKKLVGRYYLEDRQDYLETVREIQKSKVDAFRKRKAMEKAKSRLPPVIDFEAVFVPAEWKQVGLIAPALAVEDVLTNACDPRELQRLQRTTKNDELKNVRLFGSNTWSSPKGRTGAPELVERGGKFVQCSIYVDAFYADSERAGTRRFVAAFSRAYPDVGREPNALEAAGYDAAGLFRLVLSKQKPQDRAAFRTALGQVKNFEGAMGTTTFDDKREGRKPLFFLTVDSKGVREIPFSENEARAGGVN
jgi:ABC-type branched-subunit amino acid transport system substrate-binding protein